MIIAQFGNEHPLHTEATDVITYVTFPEGISVDDAFVEVTDASGVWAAQSSDVAPTWVACSDPDLQLRLCTHYAAPSADVSGINI